MKKIYLGVNGCKNGVTIAEVNEDNVIFSLSVKDIIYPEVSYDGNMYLSYSGSGFSEVKGKAFKCGEKLPKDFKPKIGKKLLAQIEAAYEADGSYCDECGTFHDMDQYYDVSYIIADGALLCKGCAEPEDLLRPLKGPEDLFKAKDVTGTDMPKKKYKELTTLFCDSSGFGGPNERALTTSQAHLEVETILKEHKGKDLVCGLTGIGQFQVYVTIWLVKGGSK